MPAPPAVQRLLLIQLYHLGDVLLATPALRAARRALPAARIDFLTGAAGAQALAGNPHVDRVHAWERGTPGTLATLRALNTAGYDAVVDFHSRPRTALFTAATRARTRIGIMGRGPRNRAYTHLATREREPVYMALQKLRLLAPLGVDAASSDLRLEIPLNAEHRVWAAATFDAHGLAGDAPVVAISAVARHDFKQWGAARWAAAADRIAAAGARILLTSGPGEREQARGVAESMQSPAVWDYGSTTVKQLAALYERCAVWIGNDGGPKHLAAAVGTPTLSVVRWRLGGVWSDTRPGSGQIALDPPPPQGCDRRCARCEHIGCLGAVTVDQVVDAAQRLLAAPPAAPRNA